MRGRSVRPGDSGDGLGLTAAFTAIVTDFYPRAAVSGFRYWSGTWKDVARRLGVGASVGCRWSGGVSGQAGRRVGRASAD
ncbi:hypothetical protein [Haloprofundus salinisoli]|uniref:hypothetical protein n=1 Tax=Haloprofundus salinisoli TaxID=2876193 RepID=UPI001CCCAB26|nr:hypothetical protein [Haloprofundus salinisoli]